MLLVSLPLQFVALVLGGVIAYAAFRRQPSITVETALKHSRTVLAVSLLSIGVLSVPLSAQIADSICQRLPLWLQRDGGRVTWILIASLFAFLSGFAVFLALRTGHRKRWQLTAAVVLGGLAFSIAGWRLNTGIADSLEHRTTADGVVLQSTGSSCAAATLSNVASQYGIELSERSAARALGTTALGTSPGQMRYALHHLGIEYRCLNERYSGISQIQPPAMLFVDHPAVGSEGHVVAYFGRSGSDYEIWDPLVGKTFWSEEKVREVWHGNGILCIAPR